MTHAAYAAVFGEGDPPSHGIYVFPPRADRRGWHYVTGGLSVRGCELVMSTPDRCDWPPVLLAEMAAYLLFEEDAPAVLPGDRMPTGAFQRVAKATRLSHMFATTSTEYASVLVLPEGRCTLVHLVGATSAEIERAKKEGGAFGTMVLSETLRRLGFGYVTDTARACATDDAAGFDATWRDVAAQVEPN